MLVWVRRNNKRHECTIWVRVKITTLVWGFTCSLDPCVEFMKELVYRGWRIRVLYIHIHRLTDGKCRGNNVTPYSLSLFLSLSLMFVFSQERAYVSRQQNYETDNIHAHQKEMRHHFTSRFNEYIPRMLAELCTCFYFKTFITLYIYMNTKYTYLYSE